VRLWQVKETIEVWRADRGRVDEWVGKTPWSCETVGVEIEVRTGNFVSRKVVVIMVHGRSSERKNRHLKSGRM
jgi:hypothetical protein